jgi:hypothetical protein
MIHLVLLILILIRFPAFGSSPTVLFMSDFGNLDDSVAICKGVMLSIEPDLRILDITHEVRPFSIEDASRFLAGTTPYYPAGTIFLVVVDPGVGSKRKPIVVKSRKGQLFVLPDNGLITMIAERDGIEGVREISNPSWMIGNGASSTFHGRDIFSPATAHLALGEDWTLAGPEVKEWAKLSIKTALRNHEGISGDVIGLDGPYGNVITNISADDFLALDYKLGQKVHTRVGQSHLEVPFVRTFSDVPLNSPLLYIDSRGRIGLAINQGSFATTYRIHPPVPIFIRRPSM